MSDLIKREDVINAIHAYWRKRLETLPTAVVDGEEVYADTRQMDEILKHNKALCNFIKAIPSADRPKGVWKIVRQVRTTTLVSCPNCGKHFYIPSYTLRHERSRWKCCPICETKIKGADDE